MFPGFRKHTFRNFTCNCTKCTRKDITFSVWRPFWTPSWI